MKKKFGKHYKDVVRDQISTLVDSSMIIFSLPYLNFQIERKAKVAYCCEKNTKSWAQQTKIAPKNCILHNTYASEVIGDHPYDLVFLDLCGSISQELLKCIENVNLRTKSSMFIITLLKCREHQMYKKVIADHGGRFEFLRTKLEESNLYLTKVIEYNDTSPMMILFATRRKRKNILFEKLEN